MKPALVISILSVLVLAACGPATPEEAPAVEYRLVKTEAIQSGPAASLIEVPGIGAFRDETRLSFKVGGVIERINVREGETVEKAQRDLQRGKLLRDQEVISKVQLDNLETAAQAARAQLSQAQFASQTAEIQAQANGVVLKRFAQTGEVVSPGQPILLLGSKSSGFVMKASLADKQAVHIQLGAKAEVQFDALPGVQWPGKVIELSQAADPATGTYGVLVALDTNAHKDMNLLSGMQGRARIEPAGFNGTRSYVPIEAVVEGDNKAAWIYTVQADNTVKRQPVQVAFIQGDRIALIDALPEGTRVVSTGAAYLQDGETVQVQE
jgi:RND family efflux transporter MFP subunit